MSCDQLPLVRRMAVDRPKVLDTAPWRAHLEQCAACRDERHALARSLAVYRQVESQLREGAASGPSWEAFANTLAREQRWQRLRARMRVPLAAASVFLAVGLGAVLWPVGAGLEPDGNDLALQGTLPASSASPLSSLDLRLGEGLLRELGQLAAPAGALAPESAAGAVRAGTLPAAAPRGTAGGSLSYVSVTGDSQPDTASDDAQVIVRPRPEYRETPVRAPVLLFRSLRQQQEVRRPPIAVLPVSAPATDLGTQAFAIPRPIR